MTISKIYITFIKIYQQHKKAGITFLLTGLATAVIYFSLFALSERILHANHIIAVSIAYIVAAAFHFLVNRNVTFKVKNHKNLWQFFKYLTLLVINYSITVVILQISLWFTPSPYIGLVIAIGVTAISGYVILRFWVFRMPSLQNA